MSKPTTESAAIRRVLDALVAAGWKITEVDGEPVTTVHAAVEAVKATGLEHVYVQRGLVVGWVFFVMQGGRDAVADEVVNDYTLNLSETLDPLLESWA